MTTYILLYQPVYITEFNEPFIAKRVFYTKAEAERWVSHQRQTTERTAIARDAWSDGWAVQQVQLVSSS